VVVVKVVWVVASRVVSKETSRIPRLVDLY
jgi:hypothetical protein